MDTTILCMYAVFSALQTEATRDKGSFSYICDFGVLKMLAASFEHALYINVHLCRPDHWVNYMIYYDALKRNGTP